MTLIFYSLSMFFFSADLKVIKDFSFFLNHVSDSQVLGIDTNLCGFF